MVTIDVEVSTVHYLKAVDSVFTYLEHLEQKKIIKQALTHHSPKDNVLISLFYLEELTLKEISEITDMKSEVVKARLYRSRKKLAEVLTTLLEPETIRGYGKG